MAGGTGRHAHWLNERGWEVTLVDVSDTALERAGDAVRCIRRDLEADGLPGGSWDLILVVDFLWRPLFAQFVDALPAGGWLVVEHPTRRNLERNPHPSAHFLLGDGELPDLVPELEILLYEEGWFDGRHVARLVATASL